MFVSLCISLLWVSQIFIFIAMDFFLYWVKLKYHWHLYHKRFECLLHLRTLFFSYNIKPKPRCWLVQLLTVQPRCNMLLIASDPVNTLSLTSTEEDLGQNKIKKNITGKRLSFKFSIYVLSWNFINKVKISWKSQCEKDKILWIN